MKAPFNNLSAAEIEATAKAVCDYNPDKPKLEKWRVGQCSKLGGIDGRDIPVRVVFHGDPQYAGKVADFRIFNYGIIQVDDRGGYWFTNWKRAVRAQECEWFERAAETAVMEIGGKGALAFLAERLIEDEHLRWQMLCAIDSPAFVFMSEVPIGAKRQRKRAKKKPAPVFAVQLEMATALVECARNLAAAPDPAKLAAARRAVSALHQTLHAPELYKRASAL